MNRELGTQVGISHVTSRNKPRNIVIVGAPDTGKINLALDIVNLLPEFTFVDVPNPKGYALGTLADWRGELHHAFQRFFVAKEHYDAGRSILQAHSLIDSLAWHTYNAARRKQYGTLTEAETIAALTLTCLFLDGLAADHIFKIEGISDPDDADLYDRMLEITDSLMVPQTTLRKQDHERWPEICAEVIGG